MFAWEAYSTPSRTSKMEFFAKIVEGSQPYTPLYLVVTNNLEQIFNILL